MEDTTPNEVEVIIGGEVIKLVGVESEEYIQKIGRYIDKKIHELQRAKKALSVNSLMRTLLIAVNIADDLFKEKEKSEKLEKELEKYMLELGKLQEENFMLNEKVREMQLAQSNLHGEADDYADALVRQENLKRNVHKFKR